MFILSYHLSLHFQAVISFQNSLSKGDKLIFAVIKETGAGITQSV
jgi:hypothetical protein